jgi:aspartate kinase
MQVYKFGGASIKNAQAVINASNIIKSTSDKVIVVVSAMGKTTNALEDIWRSFTNNNCENIDNKISDLYSSHSDIINELDLCNNQGLKDEIKTIFDNLNDLKNQQVNSNFDFDYARIVSYGEILSSLILSHYLSKIDIDNSWLDARKLIKTDNSYKEAKLDWNKTSELISNKIKITNSEVYIAQGFIGFTDLNQITTLGREGSDFSASIFAWCVNATKLTIWKDVAGVLNADPKIFSDTVKLKNISYKEAIELSFYGASVIHPKTIKPLHNKSIPFSVKSFINPDLDGTLINDNSSNDEDYPCYIYNNKQILISISPKDFSFILENHISDIFKLFALFNVKVHITQNSALNFSVCANISEEKLASLILELSKEFKVRCNTNVDLLTIRNHSKSEFPKQLKHKQILLQQQIRDTRRYVLC